MMTRSVLSCDVRAMRSKVRKFEGALADYWQYFLRRCAVYPQAHALDLVVAHLGTGRRRYLRQFAQQFHTFTESLPSRDWTNQGQFHAWTNALPLTRWLLAYDLVADDGVFDPEFQERVAHAWLGYAERLLWPVAKSRVQTGDNQFFAVCLAGAVIGHIFGRSRHECARGQEMAAYAERRLADAVGHLPRGSYSGEGYYHNQVVATLATFYSACMETLSGRRVFDCAVPPHGVSPRAILEVDYHTVMPGALMVPWDASYFHPLHVKMNLVYLARMSGDPQYLRPLKRYRMFEADPRPGWGRDDDAWTWLWWPDDIHSLDQIPGDAMATWAREDVAFGLIEPDAETALFQNYDVSERRDSPGASRAQSDPNGLVLVGHGAPLILDGGFARLPDADTLTPPEHRGRTGCTGFGFHNCLVFNGEVAAGTPQTTAGRLTRFVRTPVLSVGEADVTTHYADYGVTVVRRRTLQLGNGLFLSVDDIKASQVLDVTWSLWTRPYARESGGRFIVDTPERVRLTVVPPMGTPAPVKRVEGMPAVLENAASWLRVTTCGAELRLVSVLQVASLTHRLGDLSADWEAAVDRDGKGLHNVWQKPASPWPAAGTVTTLAGMEVQLPQQAPQPLPQRFIWDYMDRREAAPAGRYDEVDFSRAVWLRRGVKVPAEAAGRRLFVRLERPPWYFRLYVDGELRAGHGVLHPTKLGDSNHAAPGVVEIAAAAVGGAEHELVLVIAPPYASTAMGCVTLEMEAEAHPLEVARAGHWLRLADGARELVALPLNPDHELVLAGLQATDAESAVLYEDGTWAVVDAAVLETEGAGVVQCRYGRVSACYQAGQLTVSELGHDAVCEFNLPEGRVVLWGGQNWEGLAILTKPLAVHAPRDSAGGVPCGERGVFASSRTGAKPMVAGTRPVQEAGTRPVQEAGTRPVHDAGAAMASRLHWAQPVAVHDSGDGSLFGLVPAMGVDTLLTQLVYREADARGEAAAALARAAGDEVGAALRKALLEDRCWVVRCAAARSLGRRLQRDAVDALLTVLAQEQARDVYGGVTDQEQFPQWPGGSSGEPLPDFGRLPAAAWQGAEPGIPAEFLNRFRLKQAVIEALGLIGDARAVTAIAAVLEPEQGAAGLGMTGGDFYPVRKAAAEALGHIGNAEALAVLQRIAATEVEINARYAAQQAVTWLTTGTVAQEFT